MGIALRSVRPIRVSQDDLPNEPRSFRVFSSAFGTPLPFFCIGTLFLFYLMEHLRHNGVRLKYTFRIR